LGALIKLAPSYRNSWLSEIEHLQNIKLIGLLEEMLPLPSSGKVGQITIRTQWPEKRASKSDLVVSKPQLCGIKSRMPQIPARMTFETLIMDEAHNLDAVVTDVITKQFRPWALQQELNSLLKKDDHGENPSLIRALLANPQLKGNPLLERFKNALDKL
jgi:Rad3-related DNA helicase